MLDRPDGVAERCTTCGGAKVPLLPIYTGACTCGVPDPSAAQPKGGAVMKLSAVPMKIGEACEFVRNFHRHNRPPAGLRPPMRHDSGEPSSVSRRSSPGRVLENAPVQPATGAVREVDED